MRVNGHDGLPSLTGMETTATFRETRCHQFLRVSTVRLEYLLIEPFPIPIYFQAEEETTEPPPDPVNIRVSWRLSQVFSSILFGMIKDRIIN